MPNMDSRFSVAPSRVDKQRSTVDIPYRHLTTGNFGSLIPFYVEEILPGDTFEVNTRMFSRMSTPLYPTMDNAFVDFYYFFVPSRLVWSRWAEFLGENKMSAWVSDVDYIIPHAKVTPLPGSVYDHMGIPTYTEDFLFNSGNSEGVFLGSIPELDINVLPLRAYQLIWNEWFRNENTNDPILVNTGDDVTADELESFQTLCKVAKPFDYFTSALPSPQKGDSVDLPIVSGDLRVYPGSKHTMSSVDFTGKEKPLSVVPYYGGAISPGSLHVNATGDVISVNEEMLNASAYVVPNNLWANSDDLNSITINQLRQAFQMQRLLELQARAGTRYTEIIRASFGVTSPDARLQRPEYLGGSRVQIQMQQVTQQSQTTDESPLGRLGAYSKTVAANRDFNKSFTEHGFIIGVMCARTVHTYQQGLRKMWSRRGRYDIYWPSFANIGEQPIKNKEIFAAGTGLDDGVFGYQEAWAEYRFKPNEVTGAFRSTVNGNLDEWHYADYYQELPHLSSGWMEETAVNVDRTLAVTSALHDQLLFDIRVDAKATRVMPLYSIPGLIDHF